MPTHMIEVDPEGTLCEQGTPWNDACQPQIPSSVQDECKT